MTIAPKPPPKIRPTPLTPQQQHSLRFSAIRRILRSSNGSDQATKTALLARLATSAPPGDSLADELLQHMLEDYHACNGHQLAVTWLFALYKELLVRSNAAAVSDVEAMAQASAAVGASHDAIDALAGTSGSKDEDKDSKILKPEPGDEYTDDAMQVDNTGACLAPSAVHGEGLCTVSNAMVWDFDYRTCTAYNCKARMHKSRQHVCVISTTLLHHEVNVALGIWPGKPPYPYFACMHRRTDKRLVLQELVAGSKAHGTVQ